MTVTTKDPNLYPWVKTRNIPVKKSGEVEIMNETNNAIKLSKHEQFATIIPTIEVPVEDIKSDNYIRKIYDVNREDLSHLIPHKDQEST